MNKNYFPACTCDKCRAYIPPNHGRIARDFRLVCRECAEKEAPMSELKPLNPCPFCGGEPELHNNSSETLYGVYCPACGAQTAHEGFTAGDDAIATWNRRTQPNITGETSDGYHTFNELYHHRAVLFSVICNARPDVAWKAKLHHDGTMYDGMFIVGINTPDGQATYHYDVEPYWEMFHVPELQRGPEWDGHTPAQAVERIGKLNAQPDNAPLTLEELRGMDGEPVYTVPDRYAPGWDVVKILDTGYIRTKVNPYLQENGYGKTWVCYRRKPEPEGGEG